jgi:dihydrodipicolinate synthase/N-acetylneuraminate lyase
LLEPVLRLAAEEVDQAALNRPFIKVAGICGPVEQALKEAELAKKHGYHFGLLSPGGLAAYSEKELLERAKAVAEILPVFGFYLQPAVGGRVLSFDFWLAFSEIPNVHAIKVAAFNRYQTLDVVRAVCESSRKDQIALYTGNDDNIVADLLTPYQFMVSGEQVTKRFVGGLLGHWAVWTGKAVELLKEIKSCIGQGYAGAERLLAKGIAVTDINAVVFDAKNNFKGCIPGIHEILRRQGLLEGVHCLNPEETLSPGQGKEIDRIIRMYPDFRD